MTPGQWLQEIKGIMATTPLLQGGDGVTGDT